MYWLRDSSYLGIFVWGICALLWSIGGTWLVTTIFDLQKHEFPILGFGTGLVFYLWFTNILGHFLSAELAFFLPALFVFLLGFLTKRFSPQKKINSSLRTILFQAFIFLLLTGFFTLIGRGLAIFDERKNLSLISLMANGDIPPHNPLNPLTLYQYHYGSQLLGASLVKMGGFFPWSAFDISKGIYWALTILLIYVLIRRFTSKNWAALLLTGIYPFLTGTRYLLMFLPNHFLANLDSKITLLGSSQDMGLPFSKALFADWVIGGGPPSAYPYGFINGILKPLIMAHSGTETLALATVIMIWLLVSVKSKPAAKWTLGILFAFLALTWETTYGLLAAAIACIFIIQLIKRMKMKDSSLQTLVIAGIISIPIVLLQGGTISEMLKSSLSGLFTSTTTINAEITEGGIFAFNWPPVIFSGHLGGLSIFDPAQILVGLCELGPAIFFIPWIWAWIRKSTETSKKTILTILFFSAVLGLLIPTFFTYQSSARDITRFSGYGLAVLIILFLLFIIENWKTQKIFTHCIEIISIGIMAAGGIVLGTVQLSAINKPVLAEGIDGWDARISSEVWGKLAGEGWIFDSASQNWRAAILSGKATLLSSDTFTEEDWDSLRENPRITEFHDHGFEYIYIDEDWWNALEQADREELSQSCIQEVARVENPENGILRKLIQITDCQ
ncbi:MAG: hypothetical protein AB2L18_09230 [Anaerolineaceae bacterium]